VSSGAVLVFETHSLTIDNEAGRATGWLGGTLSARGRALAAELGTRRADSVGRVYTSDLARAVDTAEIAFRHTPVPVRLDWRLREIDYGELNSAPVAAIERERAGRVDVPFPGGESYRDVVVRVASFLDDVARAERGIALVIGHTATRWALDHLLTGVSLEDVVTRPFAWREGWVYDLAPRAVPSVAA
jgi:broad specificity phosphatase PhoE